VRLSGGQKQRIAIARALLVDPRVRTCAATGARRRRYATTTTHWTTPPPPRKNVGPKAKSPPRTTPTTTPPPPPPSPNIHTRRPPPPSPPTPRPPRCCCWTRPRRPWMPTVVGAACTEGHRRTNAEPHHPCRRASPLHGEKPNKAFKRAKKYTAARGDPDASPTPDEIRSAAKAAFEPTPNTRVPPPTPSHR